MDVVVWLRSLGLGKYEAIFRENDIDETVLPSLTHENLKELGVASFGHRVKLLDAIAALRSDASAQTPSAHGRVPRPTAATPTVAPVAEPVGERRHVTVMFCDLVGSTGISAELDAEEWRDLVGAYLDAASAAVTEMGGHVAKKLGDGLMALFGYPVAQENDAERAVRAALSIQRALAEVNRKNAGSGKPSLDARIGIETGPVVVDAAGEIFGDAPNVAARVQALAEPGAVLVTARVQRQVAGLFVAEERGSSYAQGCAGAGDAVPARSGERWRTPRGTAPSHATRRSRRGNSDAHAALGARSARRRAIGADRGRARARQIPLDRRISRPPARHAAHLDRMELFAAFAKYAAPSGRRMGPHTVRRQRRAGRAASR